MTEMTEHFSSSDAYVSGFNGVYGIFDVFENSYIDGTGWITPEGYVPRERPWYKAAVAAHGEIATTTPYIDAQTGEIVVSYSKHIFDKDDNSLGIVCLDLSLDRIVKYVISTRLSEGGYGILLNENLEIIAIPIKESIGKPLAELPYKGISNVVEDLKKGMDISEHKLVDDKLNSNFILFTKRLENGWNIGILTPMDQYYQKVKKMKMFIALLGAFLALMLSFVLFRITIAKHKSDEKNELAEAASKAKSEFLAKMSHEIRTPMNAIIGMAELALRENMSDSAREHIFTVKQAGTNLLSIINDILDFSKIESGKLEIIPNNYLFSSLVNDVVSIIRMRVVDSNLSFVVNIDCNVPNSLFGDATRIRQVLLNVLSNAVKYTKRGFVSFSVNGETTEDTAILTIDVTDSGNGIKQEDLRKLFGEFVQVDITTHKGIEGTGLGLAITKKLVKAMGGDIRVHSEYGKGSTFTITLSQKICSPEPLASIDNPDEKSVLVYERNEIYADSIVYTVENLGVCCQRVKNDYELRDRLQAKDYTFLLVSYSLLENARAVMEKVVSKTQIVVLTEFGDATADINLEILAMPVHSISIANILNGVSSNFSYSTNGNVTARFIAPKARVLIVDDISTNLKVAEGLMQPYKMQIDLCLSGFAALEAVRKNLYDLVLMDHMMPEMDGIETTKLIREMSSENPHYAELPIIALTANAISGTREMFLSHSFNDFLSKPIDTIKLNTILAKWLPKEKQEKLDTKTNDSGTLEIPEMEIDGVDIKRGISITGGTLKSYMQILAIFYKDGIQKMAEIKNSLEENNYPLYTTYVHAMKSASASIGAFDLSEAAKSLEMAGKQGDVAYINQHNSQFLTALETLLNNISTALLASKKNGQKKSVDFETLKNELHKLREAVGIYDLGAINKATISLQEFTQVADIGAGIENILQKILIGEYEETISIIDSLTEEIKRALH
jgi:signal transduction histidine kinase/CheY-like chemotaxis protein/HPt (histidine-containing phosphotransfer) domain-containing protein